jgi:hypothetical protein
MSALDRERRDASRVHVEAASLRTEAWLRTLQSSRSEYGKR